ncbi:MAG: response regulator [Burkholderiales bacterium]
MAALSVRSWGWRTLSILIAAWSLACLAIAGWWLQDRLHDHREQSTATGNVRLNGVKDTLAISLRQLASLPLDLSHRPAVSAFMSGRSSAASEIQPMLERLGTDFDLPLVMLVRRDGEVAGINSRLNAVSAAAAGNLIDRQYFTEAMARGASVQFLLGRASRSPGLYFASRIEHNGSPVGVAVVKQDTDTLNRLLSAADGAVVFVTDGNGVVVLANRRSVLLKRVPDAPARPDALWQSVYQGIPEALPWEQTQPADAPRGAMITRLGSMRHVNLSSALAGTPFKVWVLEPLDEEGLITKNTWTGGIMLWVVGGVLIWLSWRRVQLREDTLRARREIVELAQALPLTVFRYIQPAVGAARFAFIGRGVSELFGVHAAAIERDPKLPWRLAGSGDRPPTAPQEFRIDSGERVAWVLADSRPRHEADGSTTYNGYWLDITTRRETQARFAAVFEFASTSYLFFDAQRGVTHCNPAALRMFGASDPQELLGRILWFPDLSPDEQADGQPSRERALADLREHQRSAQRVHSFEWRFQRVDGTVFDADVNVIALQWAGTPEFCAVVQDVTERKQMQDNMQKAREAAEAASQTKSIFLANMSHELRTPMNAIIGMTHLALEDGLPDKQRDYIDKANSAARNLLQILNDILDVSKVEAGQLALDRVDFELESVVGDMADVLSLKADEKGLELLFTAAPDLPRRLVGDPSRLRQVLVNLGGNAIKFTDAGEVTVGMEIASQDADSLELHGWVRDTGVGLSPAQIERLFQPFVQVDSSTTRRYGGTGLGLVISRQLVERMGGRMWVESTEGHGSTFHFTARFGRSVPRAPARAWMANGLRGRRVLLVDDNAAALDVLGDMLDTLGLVVDRANSAEQALTLVDAAPDAYTWFLIDWKMPVMDGIECAREILRRHPLVHPCILLVTAFARDDALRASAGLALAGVLNKPVTPSSLHDCLVQARRSEPMASIAPRRAAGAAASPPAVLQRLAGARVLLVEDHPLNQQLACELLRRAGIEVVLAKDGQEALDRLVANGPFDGVLMDCQMPVMDGYTATRELRRNPAWRDLPVIAMTASALAEDRERALASGMNAHITKPIHVESMLGTMAEWIVPPDGTATPIDTAAALKHCIGNEDLYWRVLAGFRSSEANFAADVRQALADRRWSDVLRRTHDMKGLAGTIGAHRLAQLVQTLHAAVGSQQAAHAGSELERTHTELQRVLEAIDRLLARA